MATRAALDSFETLQRQGLDLIMAKEQIFEWFYVS
jgi:hypothetical protein